MINVLFLCTGNSARSVLAEALLNHLGGKNFMAYSAGSDPAGQIQPLALSVLKDADIDITGLSSKSWDTFMLDDSSNLDSARMQLVITLCDDAANKPCPVWLGDGIRCHWGLPDPAAVTGDEPVRRAAFAYALSQLNTRIESLLALNHELFTDTQRHPELLIALNQIHQAAISSEAT